MTRKNRSVGIVDSKVGKGTVVMHPVNIYGAKIGKNCFIGPFVEIQKGVVIGDNVRIQSHSFICEGVTIKNNVFIGHGVMFINDMDPKVNNKSWLAEATIVMGGAAIGSNSTILPVVIGIRCLVGAGSVVTKSVVSDTVVAGNPAKFLKVRRP